MQNILQRSIFSVLLLIPLLTSAQEIQSTDVKIVNHQKDLERELSRITSRNLADGNSQFNFLIGTDWALNWQGKIYSDEKTVVSYSAISNISISNLLFNKEQGLIKRTWNNSHNKLDMSYMRKIEGERYLRTNPTKYRSVDSLIHKTILANEHIDSIGYNRIYPINEYDKILKYWFKLDASYNFGKYQYIDYSPAYANDPIFGKRINYYEAEASFNVFKQYSKRFFREHKFNFILLGLAGFSHQLKLGLGYKNRYDTYNLLPIQNYVQHMQSINSGTTFKIDGIGYSRTQKGKTFFHFWYLPFSYIVYPDLRLLGVTTLNVGIGTLGQAYMINQKMNYDVGFNILFPWKMKHRNGAIVFKSIWMDTRNLIYSNVEKRKQPIISVGFSYLH